MPFTKESLFYREIFEKYYHDQSRTIRGLLDAQQGMAELQRQRPLGPCTGKLRCFRRVTPDHLNALRFALRMNSGKNIL